MTNVGGLSVVGHTASGQAIYGAGGPSTYGADNRHTGLSRSDFEGGGVGGGISYSLPTNLPKSAAEENIGAMGDVTMLTNWINAMNIAAQTAANRARIPGAQGLEEASSENIAAGLAGQLDPGTSRQIATWAAERGIKSGAVGAPFNETAYLEAMGKTAYERSVEAQKLLTEAYARNPAAAIYDPSKMLISPSDYGSYRLGGAGLAETRRRNLALEQLEADRINAAAAARGGGGGGAPAGSMSVAGTTTPAPTVYPSLSSGLVASGSDYVPSAGTPSWTSPDAMKWWDIGERIGEGGNVPTSAGSMYMGAVV